MATTIYDDLKNAGVQLDSHYSDLYALANDDCRRIVGEYRKAGTIGPVSLFKSNIDGLMWYDIPFAYLPYWEAVMQKAVTRKG